MPYLKTLIKAVHNGEEKELSMCAWSRLLGVSEYFVRNKKVQNNLTDQEIIDAAIAEQGCGATVNEMRDNFLFRGARL